MPMPATSAETAANEVLICCLLQAKAGDYFDFAPSMMGAVCTSLSDLTIFSVVALYFLKCSDARCDR